MSQRALTIEEIPLGDPRIKIFADFPWRLYRNDPCWTPPLRGDLLSNRLLGLVGLLTPEHPYHRHAEVTHFIAWDGNQPVGRISAAINHPFNEYHNVRIGSFGFFEVVNDFEVARTLLDNARRWVEERGMTALRGPGEYSNATHERQGILVDGFEHPPTMELTHNPPYYAQLIERYGFRKAKDYCAYMVDRDTAAMPLLKRLAQKVNKRLNIETRMVILKDMQAEVRLIVKIYNEAWAQNWGFLPITDEEADAIANSLRLIVDPGLIRFAFINGEPAAVLGIIPDPYYALRPHWRWYGDSDLVRVARLLWMRRRIPRTRAMFFGVRPEFQILGIPALLGAEIIERFIKGGYVNIEGSLLLEDNDKILKIVKLLGGQYYKRWRIYDLPLK